MVELELSIVIYYIFLKIEGMKNYLFYVFCLIDGEIKVKEVKDLFY